MTTKNDYRNRRKESFESTEEQEQGLPSGMAG